MNTQSDLRPLLSAYAARHLFIWHGPFMVKMEGVTRDDENAQLNIILVWKLEHCRSSILLSCIQIFFLFLCENMLWMLIRSTSVRPSNKYPCFHGELSILFG